jgi:hypothetical protein
MGRSDGYLSRSITTGQNPGAVKLAEIADAMGYDLRLVKRDGTYEIVIDPPER